jgi:hypothetical protein
MRFRVMRVQISDIGDAERVIDDVGEVIDVPSGGHRVAIGVIDDVREDVVD